MKYGPLGVLIGWGITIYSIVSLAWSGIIAYGLSAGILGRVLEFLALLIVCVIAGRSLRFRGWKDMLPYTIFWAFTCLVLDCLFVVPLQSWSIFSSWTTWVGYLMVALLPLLSLYTRVSADAPHAWES